jgi:16S rRNA (cytosine967-C5)-methyltransferase
VTAPARTAAFRAIRLIATGRADLGDALSQVRDPLPDSRDRALTTDLVTGTFRWRGAIDHQLQARSRKPLARLDEDVLDALRLGAYQLLYLARVPASAVVNDAVSLVRRAGFKSAAGFTNALLRRLAVERDQLTWPIRPENPAADRTSFIQYSAVVHSHPTWLVERWVDRYGWAVTETWLRFNNEPPPLTLAVNRVVTTRDALAAQLAGEQIETRPTAHAPHGLLVTSGRALSSKAFQAGACLVQDEASQLIADLVDAQPGETLLDACASPGGKSVALAAQCGPSGLVVATDVRSRRVRLLRDTLQRCHVQHARVVHIAPRGAVPFRDGTFARVLVDAPCSGLGTVRRDPDIRWRRTARDLPVLAATQRELLARIAPLVASGGTLVYSTCSSEPEENEQVVAAFLEIAPDFAEVRTLRTDPTQGLECFYGAVLQKRPA